MADTKIVRAHKLLLTQIINKNWVAADLGIVNATLAAADSKIISDDQVIFGFNLSHG